MVKPKPSCWSRYRVKSVWTACLAFALLVEVYPGRVLHAADFAPAGSLSPNVTTVPLEYQETAYSVFNWNVSVSPQTIPFRNEPAAAGKVVRGVLNFGGDAGNSIPFIWQRDARKLFLDLNRNQDLTAAAGTFSSRAETPLNYQTFTDVRLPLTTTQGRCRMLVDLNFYDYGTRLNCNLSARCFWQGKVTLHGQDWQVGAIPSVWVEKNGSRNISFEHHLLLLRPWEQQNQAFNNDNGSLETVPFSQKLFFGGQAYQLDWLDAAPNGEVKPSLRFTEQSVALGDLNITGKFIQRLVLPGETYQVVLDRPAAMVKIPTGSYHQPEVRLEQGGTAAYLNFNQPPSGSRISVDGKTPAVLNVGGPLTNSVLVSRHGEDLRLDYRLVGVGGETYQIYQMANENRSHPPEFAVFKGDKKIASGKFEFG
jgi:hypothetical protein